MDTVVYLLFGKEGWKRGNLEALLKILEPRSAVSAVSRQPSAVGSYLATYLPFSKLLALSMGNGQWEMAFASDHKVNRPFLHSRLHSMVRKAKEDTVRERKNERTAEQPPARKLEKLEQLEKLRDLG